MPTHAHISMLHIDEVLIVACHRDDETYCTPSCLHVGGILQAKHGEGLPRVNGGFTKCNPKPTSSLITSTNYSSDDEKEEDVLMVVVVEIPPPPS